MELAPLYGGTHIHITATGFQELSRRHKTCDFRSRQVERLRNIVEPKL